MAEVQKIRQFESDPTDVGESAGYSTKEPTYTTGQNGRELVRFGSGTEIQPLNDEQEFTPDQKTKLQHLLTQANTTRYRSDFLSINNMLVRSAASVVVGAENAGEFLKNLWEATHPEPRK